MSTADLRRRPRRRSEARGRRDSSMTLASVPSDLSPSSIRSSPGWNVTRTCPRRRGSPGAVRPSRARAPLGQRRVVVEVSRHARIAHDAGHDSAQLMDESVRSSITAASARPAAARTPGSSGLPFGSRGRTATGSITRGRRPQQQHRGQPRPQGRRRLRVLALDNRAERTRRRDRRAVPRPRPHGRELSEDCGHVGEVHGAVVPVRDRVVHPAGEDDIPVGATRPRSRVGRRRPRHLGARRAAGIRSPPSGPDRAARSAPRARARTAGWIVADANLDTVEGRPTVSRSTRSGGPTSRQIGPVSVEE